MHIQVTLQEVQPHHPCVPLCVLQQIRGVILHSLARAHLLGTMQLGLASSLHEIRYPCVLLLQPDQCTALHSLAQAPAWHHECSCAHH